MGLPEGSFLPVRPHKVSYKVILLSLVVAVYCAASQHAVTQDLTLSISHIVTSDRRSDAIIIVWRITFSTDI